MESNNNLFISQILSLPFHPILLWGCFIHPGNWLPASLGHPQPWWLPADGRSLLKEVLFPLAQLVRLLTVPGKRSFVCDAQSHCASALIKSPLPGLCFQFLPFSESLSEWGTEQLCKESTEGSIWLCCHPLLHTILDGSSEMVVKKWWLCHAKRTAEGFNLSEYSLHFIVLQFHGGFPKWAVAKGSTKINCLSSGYKV